MLSPSPVFFRAVGETQRMAELARDQLSALREALRLLGDAFDVRARDKLGHPISLSEGVEGPPSDDREPTLLNEPLSLRGLSKGTRGPFPLQWLTDWMISSEQGVYSPATIDVLLAELARQSSGDLLGP